MRYLSFFLGVVAGVFELAGAIMGLGIAGVGFVFAAGGPLPPSMGVGLAMVLAIASIFIAVAIMFVRDARPSGCSSSSRRSVPGLPAVPTPCRGRSPGWRRPL